MVGLTARPLPCPHAPASFVCGKFSSRFPAALIPEALRVLDGWLPGVPGSGVNFGTVRFVMGSCGPRAACNFVWIIAANASGIPSPGFSNEPYGPDTSPASTCIIESAASGNLSVEERAVNCASTSTALVSALERRSKSGPVLFVGASAVVGCTVARVAGSTGSGPWSSRLDPGHRRAAALRRALSAQVRLQARPLLGMRSNRCASSAST